MMHVLCSYVGGSRMVIIILNHIFCGNVVNLCDSVESLECPMVLMDVRDPAILGYNMETDDTRRPALKQAKIKLFSLLPTLLGWQIIIDALPEFSGESNVAK